jgi:hypothetical protein
VRAAPRALAALALALSAGCAVGATLDTLGTLFTTPQERERLDRLRRGEPGTQAGVDNAGRPEPAVTGFVRRSDGRNTIWIDGTPVAVRRSGADPLLDPAILGAPPGGERLRIERKPPR